MEQKYVTKAGLPEGLDLVGAARLFIELRRPLALMRVVMARLLGPGSFRCGSTTAVTIPRHTATPSRSPSSSMASSVIRRRFPGILG